MTGIIEQANKKRLAILSLIGNGIDLWMNFFICCQIHQMEKYPKIDVLCTSLNRDLCAFEWCLNYRPQNFFQA